MELARLPTVIAILLTSDGVDGAYRFDLRDGVYELANVVKANGGRSRA